MKLKQLQTDFMAYLTSGDETISQQVIQQGKIDVATRLHIYSNAYLMRLREAIDNDHPILGVYLGDDLFDQMVAGYIENHPSEVESLRYFADQLPNFLAAAAPFNEHPIIADIARFERALLNAFDAADAQSITVVDLQKVPPENWPLMKLRFHPSMQFFETQWNTVETWQAIKQEQTPPAAEVQGKAYWLLWRNQDRLTEFNSLTEDEYALLTAALRGTDFSGLCEVLFDYYAEIEISQTAVNYLQKWIQLGLIIKIK